MKKLICLALIAILALSVIACTTTPPAEDGSDEVTTPVAEGSSDEDTTTEEDTSKEDDAASLFPVTFVPKWSTADAKTETNPNAPLSMGYSGIAYDEAAEITLEYCKDEDLLFTALNGVSDWPAELNDDWRGYGYVAIKTDETSSIRTLAVGQFGEKHVLVIRQHEEALGNAGFRSADPINRSPETEGERYVPYCMVSTEGTATIQQIATAAHEALYLQAWHLVPLDKQGVLVLANDRTYTVSQILEELAG